MRWLWTQCLRMKRLNDLTDTFPAWYRNTNPREKTLPNIKVNINLFMCELGLFFPLFWLKSHSADQTVLYHKASEFSIPCMICNHINKNTEKKRTWQSEEGGAKGNRSWCCELKALNIWLVPGIVFVSVNHKHPRPRAVFRWSHIESCWSHWGCFSWRLNNPANYNELFYTGHGLH